MFFKGGESDLQFDGKRMGDDAADSSNHMYGEETHILHFWHLALANFFSLEY